MKRIILLCAAALVALFGVASSAHAQARCRWDIAPANMNFGSYNVFGSTPLTATSGFQINCQPFLTAQVRLSRGANSASFTPRTQRLTTGTELLPYNLYLDAANTAIWGDGTGGTTVYEQYNASPGNKTFADTIFGTVFAGADVPPGTYTDTITATLSWGAGTSDSRNFTITTTVPSVCTVSTFTLVFGNYDPVVANATTPSDASSAVNVFCTATTSASVALDPGLWSAGGNRRMRNATTGEFLNYNIYREAAMTSVWSTTNTKSGTSVSRMTPLTLTPAGSTMFGRIFPAQDVSAGAYVDTVQAIVNY